MDIDVLLTAVTYSIVSDDIEFILLFSLIASFIIRFIIRFIIGKITRIKPHYIILFIAIFIGSFISLSMIKIIPLIQAGKNLSEVAIFVAPIIFILHTLLFTLVIKLSSEQGKSFLNGAKVTIFYIPIALIILALGFIAIGVLVTLNLG